MENLKNKDKEALKDCIKPLENKYSEIKLAFADSSLAPKEAVNVYKSVRFHLKNTKKQAGVPQYWEASDPIRSWKHNLKVNLA